MKELSIKQKAERYDEISKEVKDFFDGKQKMYSDVEQTLNYLFPELKESEDERIRKAIMEFFELQDDNTTYSFIPKKDIIAWLEKQGNAKEQINLPCFTFDDVLALQCVMETVKKVQEDKELYEQLQSLHDRLHDAYWLEKQRNKDKLEPKEE